MDRNQVEQEALARALQSPSLSNYPAIYAGFAAKGIAEADIKPRENVFSFHAWKALGRQVRKGEHGVRIATVRKGEKVVEENGEEKRIPWSAPWYVTVFHVSQTDPIGERKAEAAKPQTQPQIETAPKWKFGGAINNPEYSEESTRIDYGRES